MDNGPNCFQLMIDFSERTRLISAHEHMNMRTQEMRPSKEDTFVISSAKSLLKEKERSDGSQALEGAESRRSVLSLQSCECLQVPAYKAPVLRHTSISSAQ
jgi:hypothetical protein